MSLPTIEINTKESSIIPMTDELARIISIWKYDGIYSFYDHSAENHNSFMDGTHFACIGESGNLIGYYCFGEDARIPTVETNVYDDIFLDIGLGLRPDLCGQKLGYSFLCDGLHYAKNLHNTSQFRLSVAIFNERAIKVYKRAGFFVDNEVTNAYFKYKFFIMKLKAE